MSRDRPANLDLKMDQGLAVTWADGSRDFFPLTFLRRNSPSADARQLREEMASNPLTVLPSGAGSGVPLRAEGAELVGNYAIRIRFSDGHDTGIYSWRYLRELAADLPRTGEENRHGEAGGCHE